MKHSVPLCAALMLALLACGDDGETPKPDAGPAGDGGSFFDAGASDGGSDARVGIPVTDAGGDAAALLDSGRDAAASDASADAAASDASAADGGGDAGATDASAGDASVVESFAALYADIIGPRCAGCHSAEMSRGALNLASPVVAHQQLVGVDAAGPQCATSGLKRVIAGSPDTSLLVLKIRGDGAGAPTPPCGNPMPTIGMGRTFLDAQQVARVARWIAQGAENN